MFVSISHWSVRAETWPAATVGRLVKAQWCCKRWRGSWETKSRGRGSGEQSWGTHSRPRRRQAAPSEPNTRRSPTRQVPSGAFLSKRWKLISMQNCVQRCAQQLYLEWPEAGGHFRCGGVRHAARARPARACCVHVLTGQLPLSLGRLAAVPFTFSVNYWLFCLHVLSVTEPGVPSPPTLMWLCLLLLLVTSIFVSCILNPFIISLTFGHQATVVARPSSLRDDPPSPWHSVSKASLSLAHIATSAFKYSPFACCIFSSFSFHPICVIIFKAHLWGPLLSADSGSKPHTQVLNNRARRSSHSTAWEPPWGWTQPWRHLALGGQLWGACPRASQAPRRGAQRP